MSDLNLTWNFSNLLNQNEDFNKVQENFNDIRTWTEGNISDDNIASTCSVYSSYKFLHQADGVLTDASASLGTYALARSGNGISLTGAVFGNLVDTGFSIRTLPLFYYDSADRTVSGKTEKLRIRAQVACNATAPGINLTVSLVGVTFQGGADALEAVAGSSVGSVAINTPGASAITQGASADFAVPANGAYVFSVTLSGAMAANSVALVNAQLQSRHV